MDKKYTLFNLLFSKFISFIIITTILLSYCMIYNYPKVNYVFQIIVSIILMILLFIYIFNKKYSKFVIIYFIYIVCLGLSTLLNSNASLPVLYLTYYKITALILFLDMGIRYNVKNIIVSLNMVLILLILINFVTILAFPNGMFMGNYSMSNWFLGYKNSHMVFYLPAILVININAYLKGKMNYLFYYLFLVIILISTLKSLATTSIVVLIILYLYLIFEKIISKVSFFNIYNYFIVYIGLFLTIIVLRVQNIFAWLVVNVLHKKMTFTGRTDIWDISLSFISTKKLLGYGIEQPYDIAKKFGNIAFTHCHDTILDLLYKGGIISLISFFSLIIITIKKLYNKRHEVISKLFSVIFLCIFIIMLFEARQDAIGFYIVFILSYYIDNIINAKNIERGE